MRHIRVKLKNGSTIIVTARFENSGTNADYTDAIDKVHSLIDPTSNPQARPALHAEEPIRLMNVS